MSYRSERFNRRLLSLEQTGIDPAKDRNRSDNGLGVERMLDAIDYDDAAETLAEQRIQEACKDKLFEAEMRLVEAGKKHLIPVLLLIVENGSDREKSLEKVSRRSYFRHRDELLKFFTKTSQTSHTSHTSHTSLSPSSGTRVHMDI